MENDAYLVFYFDVLRPNRKRVSGKGEGLPLFVGLTPIQECMNVLQKNQINTDSPTAFLSL